MKKEINPARLRFLLVRRAYRAACRLSVATCDVPTGQAITLARVAACSALRGVTGKWDTCEPLASHWSRIRNGRYAFLSGRAGAWSSAGSGVVNGERFTVARWHVSAACVRWMRANA